MVNTVSPQSTQATSHKFLEPVLDDQELGTSASYRGDAKSVYFRNTGDNGTTFIVEPGARIHTKTNEQGQKLYYLPIHRYFPCGTGTYMAEQVAPGRGQNEKSYWCPAELELNPNEVKLLKTGKPLEEVLDKLETPLTNEELQAAYKSSRGYGGPGDLPHCSYGFGDLVTY